MKKQIKKGFTLTELVIVIVIIAILAAVLIPTYTGLVQKARNNNDTSLVKMLNDALTIDEAENDKCATLTKAIEVEEKAGFIVGNLVANAKGNTLVWNQVTNRFYIYANNEIDIRDAAPDPSAITLNGYALTESHNRYTFWILSKSIDTNFSTYLLGTTVADIKDADGNAITNGAIITTKGIDVGEVTDVTSISYSNNDSCQDVVIRSNSGTLSVEAPLDTVRHYGSATEVDIKSVSQSSFYEYGKTTFVDIKNGRLVITNDKEAEVGTIYLSATSDAYNDITLATMSGAELPDVVQREAVTNPTTYEGRKVVAKVEQVSDAGVEDTSKTEYIYLYAESTSYEQTKGYSNVSDLGEMVLEAPDGTGTFNITVKDGDTTKEVSVNYSSLSEEVTETKTATTADAKKGAQARAIKIDENTYELATKDDLFLFASLVNGGQTFEGCTVKLTADIDLNKEEWSPIGNCTNKDNYSSSKTLNSSDHPFMGSFDGQIHTITGLKITGSGNNTYGLFGFIKGTVSISNLTVEGTITAGMDAAIIVGFAHPDSQVTLSNLTAKGSVIGTKRIGGIMASAPQTQSPSNGYTPSISFNNCYNYASVTGQRAGGILSAGLNSYGTATFTNCTNFGTLTCDENNGYVGGIVGQVNDPSLGTGLIETTIATYKTATFETCVTQFNTQTFLTIVNCSNSGKMVVGTNGTAYTLLNCDPSVIAWNGTVDHNGKSVALYMLSTFAGNRAYSDSTSYRFSTLDKNGSGVLNTHVYNIDSSKDIQFTRDGSLMDNNTFNTSETVYKDLTINSSNTYSSYGSIKLLNNIIWSRSYSVEGSGKNIVIDLNGKTLTATTTMFTQNNGSIKIMNGTIVMADGCDTLIQNCSNVTFENVTINASGKTILSINGGNTGSVLGSCVFSSGINGKLVLTGTPYRITLNAKTYTYPAGNYTISNGEVSKN